MSRRIMTIASVCVALACLSMFASEAGACCRSRCGGYGGCGYRGGSYGGGYRGGCCASRCGYGGGYYAGGYASTGYVGNGTYRTVVYAGTPVPLAY